MKLSLKARYDGYHFSEGMVGIYNPFSILNAFDSLKLRDYWFATGTPTYLMRLLQHNHEQMNDLTGKYYDASFADYKADVEQPLPMIYQSGYLTIKDYDRFTSSYLLDFPNNEVRRAFFPDCYGLLQDAAYTGDGVVGTSHARFAPWQNFGLP